MYFEAMCVQGHTLLVDCNSDYGKQLQMLEDRKIDCVDAVPAEECGACQTQSLIASMNSVMLAQGD